MRGPTLKGKHLQGDTSKSFDNPQSCQYCAPHTLTSAEFA